MISSINKLIFQNEQADVLNNRIDFFVTCIGYEERSFYIYKKIIQKLNYNSILLFAIEDYSIYPKSKKIINEAQSKQIECCIVKYTDSKIVHERIINRVSSILKKDCQAQIHIDYSSMPRSWYCKIPELMNGILLPTSKVFFWYSQGEYEMYENEYPTVGIDSYVLFSGKPSLFERKRTHFIGVGYDSIRTNGIITLLNPELIVICEANDPARIDIITKVEESNKSIIDESYMRLSLDITDIDYMISKLSGIVNEVYKIAMSDIILVPDGPKPLIFVMSMIPWLSGEEGICCLHMVRNDKIFKPQNVKAIGEDNSSLFSDKDHLVGFSITNIDILDSCTSDGTDPEIIVSRS